MKTQGELEAAICKGMTSFELEYMGRGPKNLQAHLHALYAGRITVDARTRKQLGSTWASGPPV